MAAGKLYNETRTNIQGMCFMPGFFYHPLGNAGGLDLSVGVSIPVGTLTRYETINDHNSTNTNVYDGEHLYTALLLQANVTAQSAGHFIISFFGSCGPMLPAGNTSGLTGQIGFKVGGRF